MHSFLNRLRNEPGVLLRLRLLCALFVCLARCSRFIHFRWRMICVTVWFLELCVIDILTCWFVTNVQCYIDQHDFVTILFCVAGRFTLLGLFVCCSIRGAFTVGSLFRYVLIDIVVFVCVVVLVHNCWRYWPVGIGQRSMRICVVVCLFIHVVLCYCSPRRSLHSALCLLRFVDVVVHVLYGTGCCYVVDTCCCVVTLLPRCYVVTTLLCRTFSGCDLFILVDLPLRCPCCCCYRFVVVDIAFCCYSGLLLYCALEPSFVVVLLCLVVATSLLCTLVIVLPFRYLQFVVLRCLFTTVVERCVITCCCCFVALFYRLPIVPKTLLLFTFCALPLLLVTFYVCCFRCLVVVALLFGFCTDLFVAIDFLHLCRLLRAVAYVALHR